MRNQLLLACAFMVAGPAFADDVAPSDVVFGEYGVVESSLTGVPGDAANGRAVFLNRRLGNCLSCHANSDMTGELFHGEVGPSLDGVADRWTEADLRGILVNSKGAFPGTIMPAFYRIDGLNRVMPQFEGLPILAAQEVEDVLAYLLTLHE